MKKFTFIIATLFVATFANAQINLLHTFNGWYTISTDCYGDIYHYVEAPYFYDRMPKVNNGEIIVNLYNPEDFSLYKAITIPISSTYFSITSVSRNIYTQDNKVCFCLSDESGCTIIYNEDAQQIATINGNNPSIVFVKGSYLLITRGLTNSENTTYVYSLPGNGEPSTDIVSPLSPKRSARKIARDGQVLVETETNTYTMQGAEVK